MNDTQESQGSGRGALAEFKDAVTDLFGQVTSLVPGRGIFSAFPRHELQIVDDGFDLWVELPGMVKDQVDVGVAGKTVTVSGERPPEETPPGARQIRRERPAGPFELAVPLPDEVDALGVVARLEEGVLHVHLPTYTEARGRNIPVDADEAASAEAASPRSTPPESASPDPEPESGGDQKTAEPEDHDTDTEGDR